MTMSTTGVSARTGGAAHTGTRVPSTAVRHQPEPDSSSSAAKALALLSCFSPHHPAMGVSEIARRAQLPKSTAHRLLAVLVDWEMVTKRGTEYSPGARLTELAALTAQPDSQDLRRIALPHLLDLYEMTHETVNLCVLVGNDVRYVDQIHGHQAVSSPACVGARLPAANTAVGKALLAFSGDEVVARASDRLRPATSSSVASPTQLARELAAIRHTGIAYDRQETKPGLTCVAAPIRSWSGGVVAALSISGPVHRFRPADAAPAIRAVAASVAKLTQEARWQRHLPR
ncbi:transcriptional regulator, IclR family [Nocardia farcinica]|uniref:Pectin degradation repressor protein kdgR n=2 Tax=Nocardia farcinica TaxID=37329 RepID=A0A0H5NUP6_NOCFR|nr:IclR family transcriptional regulator [Nocardia farcinica]PFX03974.1 Pectin degradation repressor protein KdgR [Nocardia farcinica]PFX10132.1 Pectin degradation repressor protein KdgR [Nocardia farcinica]CRY73751.1 Pectin degradation repressor protein kdgR [Nocardia farcinica]SIT24621.1 transcriptional regulator, IclR family [Nocardia farcinica]